MPTVGGLLLRVGTSRDILEGLTSYGAIGFSGVLPISAYFQNGAGELVGMCWLGRCAVLGGASLGCTLGGAGVTNDGLSSCRYDDVKVGDWGWKPGSGESVVVDFLARGRGLPSAVKAELRPVCRSYARSGVDCMARREDWGGGDTSGDPRRFCADGRSLASMSLGPCVM